MKKLALNLGKKLKKTEQKLINGGKPIIFQCSNYFFCALDCNEGDTCNVPNGMGGANRGVIKNGQCCPA
ncbi:hypothetical protein MHM83_12410 [Tenacibaculum sp. Mcav3-52]|uniref:hypothetical protein n=1 Tax=unclassified Tenacibaculum TaxID=2635139 RepID=UPI0012E5619D|nr:MULTISPECIES: hypothetical protein [unclassified Tenacibaculum]MCG7502674.1 hypothetical protein [Tenacibaculum sp. Mcav3-52]MCO7186191.1 hypothetical protein [Tenacibaculum sp. XPcli2-G]GFD81090.1 hypothetical protein KUL118_39520 [Tenacibaculum sp. KUL118]